MNKNAFILLFISLLATSCANIVAPTGGPKDMASPKILANPIDSNVNFKGGKISIEFDEYIKLQDLQNELQITPFLKTNPKISVKKKNLVIELPDSILSDNTTYHIQFGKSIKDIRESNTHENLQIRFTTGPYFDSLEFSGQLFDAQSGRLDSGATAMLYEANVPDSLLLKQKPMYATKVQNGRFSFSSLPNKSFKLVALHDPNKNYTYDGPNEKVSFYNSPIQASKDSQVIMYSFFQEGKKDSLPSKKLERPGKNKKSDTIQYNILPNLGDKELFDVKDTLRVQFMDSIWKITETNIRLYEEDRLDLTAGFNYKSDKKQLQIIADWKMNTNYTLVLLENFAVDSTRKTMLDTTRFKTMNIGDYGSAVIEIEKELIRKPTLISLYKNDVLVQSQSLKDTLVVYNQLAPGNYSLRLLYDENNNGLWDTGNFYERKLPEISLELPKPILIKSNWENRIIWQKNPKKLRK